MRNKELRFIIIESSTKVNINVKQLLKVFRKFNMMMTLEPK